MERAFTDGRGPFRVTRATPRARIALQLALVATGAGTGRLGARALWQRGAPLITGTSSVACGEARRGLGKAGNGHLRNPFTSTVIASGTRKLPAFARATPASDWELSLATNDHR